MLSNLTSRADTFEESDVSLSTDIVGNILKSQENGTEVPVAHGVLQTVDNLLSVDDDVFLASQENHNAATRLLQSVERLSLLIESDNGPVTIETLNILLTVAEVNVTGFNGLHFPVSTSSQSNLFNVSSDSTTEDTRTSIELPLSLFENVDDSDKHHVENAQFLAYRSNKLFKVVDNRTLPGFSPVIAASIGDLTIINLREPLKIRLAKNASYRNVNESCVFWDYTLNGGSGAWSSEGCAISLEENDNNSVLCECDHLTNFALLVDIYNEGTNIDSTNKKALSIISYVGCMVSLISLALTLVTLIAFKKTKDKATKILLNLCFALFMAMMMFIIGSFADDFASFLPALCTTVAVLLHYFLLAVLAWMALEAALLYLLLVKVFKTYIRRFMLKFCLVGWGVPLVIVSITLTIDLNNYGNNNSICWLSRYPFYGAFLAPLCLVLIFNSIIYCLVIYQICGLNSKAMTPNERYSYLAQLRAALGLMVLLGLTWVFAFFAVGQASLLFNYLFALFNSLQGLFIFVFHCAMKTEIKAGWKKTFCRCMVASHRAAGDSGASTNSLNALNYEINKAEEMETKLVDEKFKWHPLLSMVGYSKFPERTRGYTSLPF
ncbi:adhesion G-protein coupled receptor G6-like [Ptychodera flava]|uniref:adhesion G-protein coupled receptor G6-like n=1 Tax=Ptychodera flava TaxID=63121 RepID=UPI00396A2851